MRRLVTLALVAAPLALVAAPAAAVDCSRYVYVYPVGPVRGQDLDCWRDYADSRIQIILDKLPI